MGLKKLNAVIQTMPEMNRGLECIQHLAHATGKKIKSKEQQRLSSLLANEWQRFTTDGLRALEALIGVAAPCRAPTRFDIGQKFHTGIAEQSGLAFYPPAKELLVVNDEASALWRISLQPDGGNTAPVCQQVAFDGADMDDLEGIAHDPESSSILMLSEDRRCIWEVPAVYQGDEPQFSSPIEIGRLPDLATEDNNGWEGIDILPSSASPDHRARVLAVNEDEPRGVGVFDRKHLDMEVFVTLPPSMSEEPEDISDLAVDPRTGHLFLLSDRSNALYECQLVQNYKLLGNGPPVPSWSLTLLGKTELPPLDGSTRLQPEGLAFDDQGDLWVVSEGDHSLLQLMRQS